MSGDIVDRIAEKLPIKQAYLDAAHPAAKVVGSAAEDITKTLRLALFPFQFAAAAQDRLERFIDRCIRGVPEERRVCPVPQVLGGVMEGIRFEPEGTILEEMFRSLLSGAMDSDRISLAHPSYPMILKQLSRDEAVIVEVLSKGDQRRTYLQSVKSEGHKFSEDRVYEKNMDDLLKRLSYPSQIEVYGDHLYHIGLAAFTRVDYQRVDDETGTQIAFRQTQVFHLTTLGKAFIRACSPDGEFRERESTETESD